MIEITKFVDSLGPLSISKDDAAVACEALRCEAIVEAKSENARLRAGITAFGKALSLPGGPSLAVQKHDPSWEAWKTLCDISAGHQQKAPTNG